MNLRVFGFNVDPRLRFKTGKQRELLLTSKKGLGITEQDLAMKLGVSRRCLRGWMGEVKTLPKSIFHKIIQLQPKLDVFATDIEEILPPNWGAVKGGKRRYNQLLKTGMFAAHHERMLEKRREKSKMERMKLPNQSSFYVCEIEGPKIPSLPLLATLLLTDGYLQKRGLVGYASTDQTLMNIFIDLVRANSEKSPNLLRRSDGRLEAYVFDPKLVEKLLLLSPSYKKSPENLSKKEYLQESQPTVDFLLAQDIKTRICSIRLAMSADGCVTPYRLKKGQLRPRIMLCCANPSLVEGWRKVFWSLGIETWIKGGKKWSGVEGLMVWKRKVIEIFRELGGFVNGVKITRKSPNFAGVEKNVLLDWTLES